MRLFNCKHVRAGMAVIPARSTSNLPMWRWRVWSWFNRLQHYGSLSCRRLTDHLPGIACRSAKVQPTSPRFGPFNSGWIKALITRVECGSGWGWGWGWGGGQRRGCYWCPHMLDNWVLHKNNNQAIVHGTHTLIDVSAYVSLFIKGDFSSLISPLAHAPHRFRSNSSN